MPPYNTIPHCQREQILTFFFFFSTNFVNSLFQCPCKTCNSREVWKKLHASKNNKSGVTQRIRPNTVKWGRSEGRDRHLFYHQLMNPNTRSVYAGKFVNKSRMKYINQTSEV